MLECSLVISVRSTSEIRMSPVAGAMESVTYRRYSPCVLGLQWVGMYSSRNRLPSSAMTGSAFPVASALRGSMLIFVWARISSAASSRRGRWRVWECDRGHRRILLRSGPFRRPARFRVVGGAIQVSAHARWRRTPFRPGLGRALAFEARRQRWTFWAAGDQDSAIGSTQHGSSWTSRLTRVLTGWAVMSSAGYGFIGTFSPASQAP